MVVVIKIRNLKKVERFVLKLPKPLMTQLMNTGDQFMSAVEKSAKLRAPKWSGALAKSIRKHAPKHGPESGNIVITVDSPYGAAQEFGFDSHSVPGSYPTRAGNIFADWLVSKNKSPGGARVFKPKKPGGYFIGPAIEVNLSNLPTMLKKGARKAIAKAGG